MPAKKITTIAQWKGAQGIDLELPSGNVCKVKRGRGIQVFIKQGRIPNSLLNIIQKSMRDGEVAPESLQTIATTPEMISDMVRMVDDVTVEMVLEPKVQKAPMNEDDRRDDLLYVDEVDLDDKMFIFQWATSGAKDLETFRSRQNANVAALQSGEGIQPTSVNDSTN